MRAWQRWHATSCYACGRNLAYQSGAAVVKCPGCESVLNVRGLALHDVAGQAECTGCHQIMVFPAAAAVVNTTTATTIGGTPTTVVPGLLCTTCRSYTPAPPPLFFNCAGCRLYVTYCARLRDVICAVCLTVFPPSTTPPPYPALAPLNPALRRPQRPPPVLPPSGARNAPLLLRSAWLHVPPHPISVYATEPNTPTSGTTTTAPTPPVAAAAASSSTSSTVPTTVATTTSATIPVATTTVPLSPQPQTPDLSATLQPPLNVSIDNDGDGQNNTFTSNTTTSNTITHSQTENGSSNGGNGNLRHQQILHHQQQHHHQHQQHHQSHQP